MDGWSSTGRSFVGKSGRPWHILKGEIPLSFKRIEFQSINCRRELRNACQNDNVSILKADVELRGVGGGESCQVRMCI